MKVKALAIIAVGVFVASSISQPPLARQDQAREEKDQLRAIRPATSQGPSATLVSCDAVIRKNPRNRMARLIRARSLLELGRIEDSKRELLSLRKEFPTFREVLDLLAGAAIATGDTSEAVTFYKERMRLKPVDPELIGLEAFATTWYEMRILELEGKTSAVEKELVLLATESDAITGGVAKEELAGFYLRHGKPGQAVGCLKSLSEVPTDWSDSASQVRLLLGIAHWASGNREEALKSFLSIAEALDNVADANEEFRAKATLGAVALARRGTGTNQDAEKAEKLLKRLTARFPVAPDYPLRATVLAAAGRNDVAQRSKGLARILEKARYLEWALWEALYLGLTEPREAGRLLELLPAGTVQRRIADLENKTGR